MKRLKSHPARSGHGALIRVDGKEIAMGVVKTTTVRLLEVGQRTKRAEWD